AGPQHAPHPRGVVQGGGACVARRRARGGRRRAVHEGRAVSQPLVAVLDYGIGNLRSAQKSLQRVGADARLTADADLIARADAVVLPGVGAFGACMQALESSGIAPLAVEAARSGRPPVSR